MDFYAPNLVLEDKFSLFNKIVYFFQRWTPFY